MFSTAFDAIHPLPVLAASAMAFVLGGVYFGVLTPRLYAHVMGRSGMPPERPGPLMIAGPFLCNLVMILATSMLMGIVHVESLGQALQLGLLIGVGYLVAMCMMVAINPNFPHPFLYTALNAPYLLANILGVTTVLFVLS